MSGFEKEYREMSKVFLWFLRKQLQWFLRKQLLPLGVAVSACRGTECRCRIQYRQGLAVYGNVEANR